MPWAYLCPSARKVRPERCRAQENTDRRRPLVEGNGNPCQLHTGLGLCVSLQIDTTQKEREARSGHLLAVERHPGAAPGPGSRRCSMDHSIRLSNQLRITAVLAALMVILGVVTVLAFRTTTRMIQDRDWVAHSQQVLAELQETRALIDDAEDEQRGYLITGDENLLAQFEEVLQRFVSRLDPLRLLMTDNPAQQQRIDRLATAAQTKFASMRAIIDTR